MSWKGLGHVDPERSDGSDACDTDARGDGAEPFECRIAA
jgi:hypothetical protein